ncbi:DNA polymerase III subunit delta [Thermosulfurimonas marina]|uniref:DNA-directed DNA polymerase n=1 Tax=Thermosulfurimonas marina TaxID=2047767 RepID=A0A6H1WR24_9BACT|nr:DNA polymerase III subunit delta [Thermosulfurimonas marina]QJA05610.1 DNA polymerase III subunit delta [Thermosulfurimonas marina]
MPVFAGPHLRRLLELARKGRVAPLYLFCGEAAEAREKAAPLLEILSPEAPLEKLDLSEAPLEAFWEALSSGTLFGPRKVLWVEGGERFPEKEIPRLREALSSGLVTLVLQARELSEEAPLYRLADEIGAVVPLVLRKGPGRFLDLLSERLSAEGRHMDRATAEYFLALVGEDYLHFRQELEKLLLYTAGRKTIEREDVEAVVVPPEEAEIFRLAETALLKGPEDARRLLRRLLDRGESPVLILGHLAAYFKRLWLLNFLAQEVPELGALRRYEDFRQRLEKAVRDRWEHPPRVLRVHPYALFRMRALARKLPREFFPAAFSALYALDLAIKRDFQAPERAFFQFFLTLYRLRPGTPFPESRPGAGVFGKARSGP